MEYCFFALQDDAFPPFLRSNAFMNLILMRTLLRSTLLRIGCGREDDDEVPQRSPYRLRRNSNLRNASYGEDLLNGSMSSLDTIGLQRPPSPCFTL